MLTIKQSNHQTIISNMDFGYFQLYIGGQLVDATNQERYEVICPANEEKVASIAWAGKENSGIGHDCSHLALNDYLVKKRVTFTLA